MKQDSKHNPVKVKPSRNEKTSGRIGTIESKWANRLKAHPKQQRFNVGRKDLAAMSMSGLTQRPAKKK